MLILAAFVGLPFYARRPVLVLLCNILLQTVVLGGTQEVSSDKIWYAAYFLISLAVLTPAAIKHWRESVQVPFVRWLLALFVMFALSRIVGAAHDLTAGDWFDLSPMLNYVFIFLGVSVFSSVKDIRQFLVRTNILLLFLAIPTVARWMWYREVLSESSSVMYIANAWTSIFLFGFFIALLLAIDSQEPKKKASHLGMCAVFMLFMLLCGMRSEIVSTIVGCVVTLAIGVQSGVLRAKTVMRMATTVVVASGLIVGLAMTWGVINVDALSDRFAGAVRADVVEDQSFTNRIVELKDSLDAFAESPILGKGLGFQTNSLFVFGNVTFANDQYFIHIMPAYVAAKFGLIGLIIVAGFYVQAVRTALSVSSMGGNSLAGSFGAMFVGLTVCLLTVSLTSNQLVDRTSSALFGLLGGLLVYFAAQQAPARQ